MCALHVLRVSFDLLSVALCVVLARKTVRISRSVLLSSRGPAEYFYIGINNNANARAALSMNVTLSAFTSFQTTCAPGAADCLRNASVSLCQGRGVAVASSESPNGVVCEVSRWWSFAFAADGGVGGGEAGWDVGAS